jgi:hypothetical protein
LGASRGHAASALTSNSARPHPRAMLCVALLRCLYIVAVSRQSAVGHLANALVRAQEQQGVARSRDRIPQRENDAHARERRHDAPN